MLIALAFAIGPALLIHFMPDVLSTLPEVLVILSVSIIFLALWSFGRRRAILGGLRDAYRDSSVGLMLSLLRDWRSSETTKRSRANMAVARRVIEDVIGQGRSALINELIAPDVILHYSSAVVTYETRGRDAFRP